MSDKKYAMNVEKTAKRLKKLRENEGLSHIELAKKLIEENDLKGRDNNTMSPESLKVSLMKYEETEDYHDNYGSVAGMATNTLYMLADYYKVSTDYLLGISEFPSIDEDLQKVNKLTGLSVRAIETLKLWLERSKKTEENQYIYETYKNTFSILNYLIENDLEYGFFIDLANYLWFKKTNKKVMDLNQPIVNDDLGYTMTIKEWEALKKVKIDEKLFLIKKGIEEAEKDGEYTGKKK